MGWNELLLKKKACPLFHGLPDSPYVYFCHSYYPQPDDKRAIAATCDYAKDFAAVIWQENILGVQFHPEKSQENGIMMLKNFVKRC